MSNRPYSVLPKWSYLHLEEWCKTLWYCSVYVHVDVFSWNFNNLLIYTRAEMERVGDLASFSFQLQILYLWLSSNYSISSLSFYSHENSRLICKLAHMKIALNSFCLLSVAFPFSINAPVHAICLVDIIIIPKITLYSFVSLTVPRNPVNKFLSIDQIPVTCLITDDTYPLAPFVFAHVPSVLFSQNRLTFSVSLTPFSHFPSCLFLPGYCLACFYSSRFPLSLCFIFYLYI